MALSLYHTHFYSLVCYMLQLTQYRHGELISLFQVTTKAGHGLLRSGSSFYKQGVSIKWLAGFIIKQHCPFCQWYSLSQETFWSSLSPKTQKVNLAQANNAQLIAWNIEEVVMRHFRLGSDYFPVLLIR